VDLINEQNTTQPLGVRQAIDVRVLKFRPRVHHKSILRNSVSNI